MAESAFVTTETDAIQQESYTGMEKDYNFSDSLSFVH